MISESTTQAAQWGTQTVSEQASVNLLIDGVEETGVLIDPIAVVNLYVALKSKPLAIVYGPAHTGKTEAIQGLAHVLAGSADEARHQTIKGHAWWAANSGNVALFTEAQTRFTTLKLMAMLEEASQPGNEGDIFITCLNGISRGELNGFFSEVAFQLQHRDIIRLPGLHLAVPIPYPFNHLLVGTIDSDPSEWLDETLLTQATIICWTGSQIDPNQRHSRTGTDRAVWTQPPGIFIRDVDGARAKLALILDQPPQSISLFPLLDDILRQHAIRLPDNVLGEILIYLANAWSQEGVGLFAPEINRNLAIAADFATTQILLPRVMKAAQISTPLRTQLQEALEPYPYATAFLENQTETSLKERR